MSAGNDTKRLEDISHDTRHRSLTRSWITRKDIMLALEGIRLSTFDLQIQESSEIRDLLLHRFQTYEAIQLFQTFRDIHRLRCLVWYICLHDGHQFLIAHRRDALTLQTLSLSLTDLVKQGAHRTTIGEVLVTRVVQLLDHLLGKCLCLW